MPTTDATTEIWKPVIGYEGSYEVSNLGRVRRTATVLKPFLNIHGYPVIALCRQGQPKTRMVHSLVMEAFTGPRPRGYEVNHLDCNRTNNTHHNLQYCTHAENIRYSCQFRRRRPRDHSIPRRKLDRIQVAEVKRLLNMGVSGLLISRCLGVSQPSVSAIKRFKQWA